MKYEYIMSTSFFITIRNYYPDTFTSFWEKMDEAVIKNKISSVSEVREELKDIEGEKTHLMEWVKRQQGIFSKPKPEEQDNVRKIFKKEEFQSLVKKQKILEGYPDANPFVIAKAMTVGGTIVTTEKPAQRDKKGSIINIPKIPDACKPFNILCISPQEFMERMKWRF